MKSSFSKIQWHGLSDPKSVSNSVMELSDLYISEEGSPVIWDNEHLVQAYLNYFLPLNTFRTLAILEWLNEVGFTNLFDEIVEFGSGPGTFQIAAHHSGYKWKWTCLEASAKAQKIHQEHAKTFGMSQPDFTKVWPTRSQSLFTSSYVLNETELPTEAFSYDHILIIEPSTQNASRKLMELRSKLIDRGYHIWAPCTHMQACPLLENSKKDWCHFRVHWDQPEWFQKLEEELPIKNRTLTVSYLAASKVKPENTKERPARVIGDTLNEKGKVRQALCRGDQREFMSWLKRFGEASPYPSGELIDLPESITIKGNELRMNMPHE